MPVKAVRYQIFKLGVPIQVANQNYILLESGSDFIAEVTLQSKEAEINRFVLLLDPGEAAKKAIFRRIADGTYKQGVMQIVHNSKIEYKAAEKGIEVKKADLARANYFLLFALAGLPSIYVEFSRIMQKKILVFKWEVQCYTCLPSCRV